MDNISDDKIINDNATNNGSNNNIVISRRLEAVRGIMKEKGVDIYVVVTGDYHNIDIHAFFFHYACSMRDRRTIWDRKLILMA